MKMKTKSKKPMGGNTSGLNPGKARKRGGSMNTQKSKGKKK